MYYELTDHFIVASSLDQAWRFFSNARNLGIITPAWLKFTVIDPTPEAIETDSILNYTISWKGIPMRWRTRIIDYSPPKQFIDLQVRGPYAVWHHQHTFEECGEGVECRDRVIYKLPLGWVGRAIHAMIVRKQLMDIFTHRREVIGKNLGWVRAVQERVVIQAL